MKLLVTLMAVFYTVIILVYYSDSESQRANRPNINKPIHSNFNEPVQSMPNNGFTRRHTSSTGSSPLKITTSEGANYVVKLEDAYSSDDVLDVFILGGHTVNLEVPTGSYIIKYASGENWYGYKYYFGPRTGYSKADRQFDFSYGSGYEITLYKVENGNLSTSAIGQSQF